MFNGINGTTEDCHAFGSLLPCASTSELVEERAVQTREWFTRFRAIRSVLCSIKAKQWINEGMVQLPVDSLQLTVM